MGLLDLTGEPILDYCNCDEGFLCNYPECVMRNELYAKEMERQYRAGMLDPEPEVDDDDRPEITDLWDMREGK